MKELTIRAENRVGVLADIAELLGGLGVNIDAISAHGEGEHAIIRILTNDFKTAIKHLDKIPGIRVRESDIIVVDVPNRPGELGKITRKLANKGVDLESVYIAGRENNVTHMAIKPSKESFDKAKEVLGIRS